MKKKKKQSQIIKVILSSHDGFKVANNNSNQPAIGSLAEEKFVPKQKPNSQAAKQQQQQMNRPQSSTRLKLRNRMAAIAIWFSSYGRKVMEIPKKKKKEKKEMSKEIEEKHISP